MAVTNLINSRFYAINPIGKSLFTLRCLHPATILYRCTDGKRCLFGCRMLTGLSLMDVLLPTFKIILKHSFYYVNNVLTMNVDRLVYKGDMYPNILTKCFKKRCSNYDSPSGMLYDFSSHFDAGMFKLLYHRRSPLHPHCMMIYAIIRHLTIFIK